MTRRTKFILAVCLVVAALLGGVVWVSTYQPLRMPAAVIKVAGGSEQKATVALRVELPPEATKVVRTETSMDGLYPGFKIEFEMPSDQWREYVKIYYPLDSLSKKVITSQLTGGIPAYCDNPFRSGKTELIEYLAGDRIPYFGDKDTLAGRALIVTPDCRPGVAKIQWSMSKPESEKRQG